MKRRIAVVGDTLTSGGYVLPYEQKTGFTFHGHAAALIGGNAYCETCHSTGTIAKAGGPKRISYMGAREAALDRDIVLCKCERHPQIIAVHAGNSTVDDEAERYAAAARSTEMNRSDASNAHAYARPGAAYDEQVAARARHAALPGYPYVIETADGKCIRGRIDGTGHLPRVHTDSDVTYSIHWGEDALIHKDWN
ncbi:PAAR domain-containing protein [Paraburkholderia sp. 2C]|jgi:PAAR motif-containing protein